MGYPTKIATCCYCGSRAALVLDRSRHELSCASCGAPLHNMKKFPQEPLRDTRPDTPKRSRSVAQHPSGWPRDRGKKRRRGLLRHVFEEAIDALEDIFD